LLFAVTALAADVALPFHHALEGTYSPETGFGFETASGNLFSVKVPEGNYQVSVAFAEGCKTTVKAESRRLMLEQVSGGGSFTVNVRNAKLPAPPLKATRCGSTRANRARSIGTTS
jgi:hypothetical protein